MIFDDKHLFKPWNGWARISANLHFILVLLVSLTLPIDVETQFCSIAIVLLFINWVAGGRYKRKFIQLGNHKSGLVIILFFLLHLLGLLYTEDMHAGLFDIEKKLSLLILPLILFSSPLSTSQRDFVLVSFVLFCVFLAVIGLGYGMLHYTEVVTTKGPEHLVTFISSIHRVYFSIYLLFGYFLVFYFYRKFRLGFIPILKWSCLAFAGFISFLILIMASRAVLILLIITTGSIIFYFVVIKRKQYIKAGILSAFGVIFLILVYTQVGYVRKIVNTLTQNLDQGKSVNVTSVNLRVEKYKCAIQAIKANWIVGVGTGDVQNTLNAYYRLNNFYEGYTYGFDAHNQYFQSWIGLGLPGIILFLGLLILGLIHGIKELNYTLIYFILLFSVCCMSESLLTTQKGIVFFALFFPLIYSNRSNLAALYSPYTK